MTDSKMITVIIPAYQAQDTIKECLTSVLSQDYPEHLTEILVIDDGSTDDTAKIAEEIAKEHDRIRVIRQDNAGPSSARNRGIREAKGAWLSFLDSDDRMEPRMLSVLMGLIEKHGTQIAQIARNEEDPEGNALPDVVIPGSEEEITEPEEFLRTLLMHEGDASFCTKLTERQLFSAVYSFPEGRRNEDFHLMMRLCGKDWKMAMSPKRLYTVIHRAGSGSRFDKERPDYIPQGLVDALENADDAYAFCEAKYPDLTTEAMRFSLFQRLDYLLHVPLSQMRGDNPVYTSAVRFVKKHRRDIRTNPYLSDKERKNLTILSYFPRLARKIHAMLY